MSNKSEYSPGVCWYLMCYGAKGQAVICKSIPPCYRKFSIRECFVKLRNGGDMSDSIEVCRFLSMVEVVRNDNTI